MKKFKLLLLIITLPHLIFAQSKNIEAKSKSVDYIKANIYRIDITQPIFPEYETITLSGIYEHRIKNSFSFLGKIGIGTSVRKFGSSSNRYQTSFHLYSAIEARYYFTLKRRQKKEKPVLNFSCPYLAIEQNLFTNPIVLINQTSKDAFEGNTRTFINLGYQKQIGKLHLGAFFGVSAFVKDFSIYDKGRNISPVHGGLMLGYVFD
ncbi:MAG TPA: hypothetical protein PKA77_01520 [Chitinophagaceae bacterium]|jgi:hypothetical protein|nr:hypothetical protein [Chitinophagaceae bacterium]HMU57306.1 hypothetical protein [Chitinophagaceae bacterium]